MKRGPAVFRAETLFLVLVVGLLSASASAQVGLSPRLDRTALPASALQPVRLVNVRGADLRDVLRAIGAESGLNLVVDDRIDERVTVSLESVSAADAVEALARDYGLDLSQTGSVVRVRLPIAPAPAPLAITIRGDALSVDLDNADVGTVVRRLTEVTGANVVLAPGTSGTVSAYLEDLPFETGLAALFETNGYVLRERGGVYIVEPGRQTAEGSAGPAAYGVEVDIEGRYALDLRNADVAETVREIARRSLSRSVVSYTLPQGQRVSLRANGLSLEEALQAVLRGTGTSFRREGSILVVGTSAEDRIQGTQLIELGYVDVEDVFSLIPPSLTEGASVQAVPGLNAVLVTGTNDRIGAVEAFLASVDVRAPQIFIEALVVDFLDTDVFEAGLSFGRGLFGADTSGTQLPSGYVLDGIGSGAYETSGNGTDANGVLETIGDAIGVNVGRLPADFYYRIRLLETEGRVEVRSRPQIATLNGNTASISVGTTQYYLLEQTSPIIGGNQVITQTTQRFEQIEANATLEVTPFVGPGGEITVAIRPEFSQPVGEFVNGVPPTISTRVVESTVRLRDGETIILGGLVEDRTIVNDRRVPFLGRIPLLGRLFRSTVREVRRSELVIYLTPYVFYGDGRDGARWQSVVDRQGLTDTEEAGLTPQADGDRPAGWERENRAPRDSAPEPLSSDDGSLDDGSMEDQAPRER